MTDEELTLYKFRSLGDDESLNRAHDILTTGKFWCTRLWEMNDPMEGVFTLESSSRAREIIDELFFKKDKRVICCFSQQPALESPTMWGYYANGFKGYAVEIQVDEDQVVEDQVVEDQVDEDQVDEDQVVEEALPDKGLFFVSYEENVTLWKDHVFGASSEERLRRILTTKLTAWEGECEVRYIATSRAGLKQIGKVTGVYFGLPYSDVLNYRSVVKKSKSMQDYLRRASMLSCIAKQKKIPCFAAQIVDDKVSFRPLSDDEFQ